MANEYKSFYLKDLEALTCKTMLETLMSPQKQFLGDQASKVEDLKTLNDRICHYNEGVRAMAMMLMKAIGKDDEDDAG